MAAFGGELTPRLDETYQTKVYFVTNNGCFTNTGATGCGTGAQGGYGLLKITFFGREEGNVAPPLEWGITFKRNF